MQTTTRAPGLYRRLLGRDFDRLPPSVRRLHDLDGESVWQGRCDVQRGNSRLARLAAAIAGLPPEGAGQSLRVTFTACDGEEIWHREFGTKVFRTRQWASGNAVCERIGPAAVVTLMPGVAAEGLSLSLAGLHVLGVPVPRFMHPAVATREYEVGGRYHFEVELRAPWLGRIVRYAGWLEPGPAA